MAKKALTYNSAYEELEQILEEIQSDQISIDLLAEKVKRSKELLKFCKDSLRKYQEDIDNLKDE